MSDSLNYREPAVDDAMLTRRRRARQAVAVGAVVLLLSIGTILLPLLIPTGDAGKYIVALAFVGIAGGIGMLANGGIDWLRALRGK